MKRPKILVCNDDGIHGPGLPALITAMRRIGHVTVSVPEHERSADSHSLTLHKPIRVRRQAGDVYTLNGSPADCARFGILEILKGKDYRPAAAFAQRLARQILAKGLPKGVCLNVNFPAIAAKTYAAGVPACLGRRIYGTTLTRRRDPRGLEYYWLAGRQVSGIDEPGTDVAAVSRGKASVTPLKIDSTDTSMLTALSSWRL